jgi:hypothetical protein
MGQSTETGTITLESGLAKEKKNPGPCDPGLGAYYVDWYETVLGWFYFIRTMRPFLSCPVVFIR